MKRSRLLSLFGWGTMAFLYLPLLILVVFSFNRSKYGAGWEGFTLEWYVKLFRNEKILRAAFNSLVVASLSCLAGTALGVMAAVAQERFPWRRKALLEGFFYLPLVIPELMMAVGFLLFFGVLGWRLGLGTLVAAHVTFNVPLVWLITRARLKKLDARLEDAAVDLGATRWQAFRKVTLPLLAPAVAAGALMAFVISLDCFIISFFVAGPDNTTLPVQIYSMLKFSISPEVHALSTVLFLVSMALVAAAWLLGAGEEAHA